MQCGSISLLSSGLWARGPGEGQPGSLLSHTNCSPGLGLCVQGRGKTVVTVGMEIPEGDSCRSLGL